MSSIREQILDRCKVVLLQASTPAGGNVSRSREISITRAVSPSIVVLFGGEQDHRMGENADAHDLKVSIQVYVRGDPWDTLADAVADPAHTALMADAARSNAGTAGSLAALGVDLRKVSTDSESEEADRTSGCLLVTYSATYLTSAASMSRAPAP